MLVSLLSFANEALIDEGFKFGRAIDSMQECKALEKPSTAGKTATITITGTNSTFMPCSHTGTLRERYHFIDMNAKIGYVDHNGDNQICVNGRGGMADNVVPATGPR